eukprot:1023801-Alexandrium_andersonii.AAC.1
MVVDVVAPWQGKATAASLGLLRRRRLPCLVTGVRCWQDGLGAPQHFAGGPAPGVRVVWGSDAT